MKKQPKETKRRRKLRAMLARLKKMEKRNWQKHFAKHPEQLLPGAKVERKESMEEAKLWGKILWLKTSAEEAGEEVD